LASALASNQGTSENLTGPTGRERQIMDPQTAIDTFNDPNTCRAERAEIAKELFNWLVRGGFAPEGSFSEDLIQSLRDHNEWQAALLADRCNGIIGRGFEGPSPILEDIPSE